MERRDHINGYCYDERGEEGIFVRRYGLYIFRTDSKPVWDYLSQFTDWEDYQHWVLSFVEGHFYPILINLDMDTVNGYLDTSYIAQTVMEYFETHRTYLGRCANVRDVVESQIGPEFYRAFFERYTQKQWGMPCEELRQEIVARIPIRANHDDRYFTHRYQVMPRQGYTQMIRNLLDHLNIHLLFNTDYRDIRGSATPPCCMKT